ncbi:putative glycosyltransferase [Alphaspiravirus yamagawaense]|uniref:Putative glycosyltransferase n=1 Tax=Alphaspiravirus yamagawaense TaxID=1157339 RepID=J7QDG9_9VIRU|nr:putative glycosyltransferase [Aeropyrum coil-shaped virus]CCG27851.1 putative glycosyltransferase [Aeropyrum coil-shaped virus]
MGRLLVRHSRAFSLTKKAREIASILGGILLGPNDNIIVDYPAVALYVLTANNLDLGLVASTYFQARRNIFYAIAEGRPKLHWLAREMLDNSIVIAPSEYSASKISEAGIHVERVIHFAVTPPKVDYDYAISLRQKFQGKKLVVWVGANMYRKGVDLIEDAAETLGNDYAVYVVTGPGDYNINDIKAKNVHVDDRVFRLPEDKLGALYYAADALLMTTRNEGFGLPSIEATLIGTPAVIPEHPVLQEVLGDCGFFYEVRRVRIEDFFGLMDMEYYEPDISTLPEAMERALREGVLTRCISVLSKRFGPDNYKAFLRYLI